ncbi:MAG TPA: alpha/beta hydrolase, partial [Gemmatimonadaceae bacterium]|nr:alpha/beta hydrolase [Gemmatimonadaceae bacterium]
MHWKNLARPFFLALLVSATSRAQVPAGHFLTVDSSRIYFEECGTGPAVVLLHDGLVHAVTWDPVWNALCARFHVLRYDRRGMGRSTAPKVPFIPTEDLTALLADRKIQSATLVGSSSGAGLALDVAIRHPDKVDRLVLLGPVVHGMATSTHFLERGERNNAPLATGDTRAAARNWADDRYQIAPGHDAARNALFDALASSPQNLTYPGNLELHFAVPAAARLGEIRAPTLILVGASDIADVQAYAGAVELGVWGARREVVANSGHLIQLEWPDFVVDAVTRFINEHPVVTIAAGTLASYAGTYDTLMYGRSGDFYVKDNRLYVKILTERDLPLFPSSDSTFYTLGRDGLNFRFTKDAQGAPTGVEAGTRDGKHFATRAKPPAAPPARPDSVKEEPARTAPGLSLRPCAVPPNDGTGQCGTFDVFEDRGAKAGRKIALRIVLLPALNARHAPDPVFWLAGGPGAASTANVFAAKEGFLAGLRAEHDIVFVDQRGTGHSNPLNCDIGDDPGNLDAYFGRL